MRCLVYLFLLELEQARDELTIYQKTLIRLQSSERAVRDKEKKVANLQTQIRSHTLRVSELEATNNETTGNLVSIISHTVANMPISVKRELVNESILLGGASGSKENPMDVDINE